MSKNWKYYPDYSKLYPGVEIAPNVLAALRESDRKMKYMEYDLKSERPVRDEGGILTELLPGWEDSLERLLETDKQFVDDAPPLWEDVDACEEIEALRNALARIPEDERALIDALFFDGFTERKYAGSIALSKTAVHARKIKLLDKLRNFLENHD